MMGNQRAEEGKTHFCAFVYRVHESDNGAGRILVLLRFVSPGENNLRCFGILQAGASYYVIVQAHEFIVEHLATYRFHSSTSASEQSTSSCITTVIIQKEFIGNLDSSWRHIRP